MSGPRATERYLLRHGDTLYRVTAASAHLATADVLAFLGDPAIWRGEIEQFTETLYRELYGEPDDVVDVPDVGGDGAGGRPDFEAGDDPAGPAHGDDEAACPVCRPGAVADGARAVRCILHGGDDEAIQPTNASVRGFRLDVADDVAPHGDAPARDMGGRLPMAGDFREPRR